MPLKASRILQSATQMYRGDYFKLCILNKTLFHSDGYFRALELIN